MTVPTAVAVAAAAEIYKSIVKPIIREVWPRTDDLDIAEEVLERVIVQREKLADVVDDLKDQLIIAGTDALTAETRANLAEASAAADASLEELRQNLRPSPELIADIAGISLEDAQKVHAALDVYQRLEGF